MTESVSPAAPAVAIVTATYNRRGDIVSLLAQVAALDYPADRLQMIVVDNGSTDGTAECVRQDYPNVQLIENAKNLGTAAGFNAGLKQALNSQPRPKYIWLLDSDVILESATLAPLVEACEQYPQVGVIGSAVYDPRERERLVAAGLRVDGKSGDITFVIPEGKRRQELIDVDLIAACSLMVRSEACEQVGLWDESLRLYWGDTDWCARFVRASYRVVCQPTSKVWHRDWTDVDRGFFTPVYLHDHIRGALLYSVRHDPQRSLASARRLVLKSYLRAALEQLTMRHAFASGYEWAIKDFLAASFGERSFETIVGQSLLPNLNSIVSEIVSCFPQKKHLTVTGSCDPQIRTQLTEQLRAQFAEIVWPDDDEPRSKFPTTWEWLGQFAQLALGFLKLPLRKDLLVAAPSRPRLTNLVAARYTLLVDAQGRGLVYRNRVLPGLWRLATTGVKGLWITFIGLPSAVKSTPLQAAIHAVDVSPKSVSSDDIVSEIKPSQVYAAR